MFAIPAYTAEFQEFVLDDDRKMNGTWQQCRVLGVAKDEDGQPAYVVEFGRNGVTHLSIEPYVRPKH